jgi:hypothetical protein
MRARGVKGAASAAELPKNRFAIAKRHNHSFAITKSCTAGSRDTTPRRLRGNLLYATLVTFTRRHLGLWPEKIVLRPNGTYEEGPP